MNQNAATSSSIYDASRKSGGVHESSCKIAFNDDFSYSGIPSYDTVSKSQHQLHDRPITSAWNYENYLFNPGPESPSAFDLHPVVECQSISETPPKSSRYIPITQEYKPDEAPTSQSLPNADQDLSPITNFDESFDFGSAALEEYSQIYNQLPAEHLVYPEYPDLHYSQSLPQKGESQPLVTPSSKSKYSSNDSGYGSCDTSPDLVLSLNVSSTSSSPSASFPEHVLNMRQERQIIQMGKGPTENNDVKIRDGSRFDTLDKAVNLGEHRKTGQKSRSSMIRSEHAEQNLLSQTLSRMIDGQIQIEKRSDSGHIQKSANVSPSTASKLSTPLMSYQEEIPNECAGDHLTCVEWQYSKKAEDTQSLFPVQDSGDGAEETQSSKAYSSNDVYDGSSSQSDNTCSSPPSSPQSYHLLIMARARHEVVVPVMKEVYAVLTSNGDGGVKQRARSRHESSTARSCELGLHPQRKGKIGKRRERGDDSSANEEDDDNKRKRPKCSSPRLASDDIPLQYACPFHKYDPLKYRPTADAGSRYRTCVGPGFKSISHLK